MEVNEDALNEIDAMYSSDEDKKRKKKGKKAEKKATPPAEDKPTDDKPTEDKPTEEDSKPETPATAEAPEASSTVMTAAQKKKLKKERNKAAKSAQAVQSKPQEKEASAEPEANESTSRGDEAAEGPAEDESEKKGDDKKKKKKKKGATGGGEDTKEKLKENARSKHIAKIRETLQRQKEEEERLRREEEERIKREEELQRQKEEQEKIEKERKEKKKLKEKERKLRLKAEGKLLTEKEKQNRRRIQELVATRGIDLNAEEPEKKKKPRYEKLKKRGGGRKDEKATEEEEKEVKEEEKKEEAEKEEEKVEKEEESEDDWEKLADEEVEEAAVAEKVTEVTETLQEVEGKKEEEESSEEDAESEKESEAGSSSEESEEDEETDPLEKARERIRARHVECDAKRDPSKLRAPVVCVLGHVDTGKTKILDKLRRTHVQDDEAGGITQQIGATNVPAAAILDNTKMCKEFQKRGLQLPGLLIIDTPGHESFSNLRSRGSSLCDLAILVVDIMHGLEPQTIESIQLLRKRKTPFIVALNKIDRLFQWRTNPASDVANTLKKQQTNTCQEFNERVQSVIAQFAMQELNACIFNENNDLDEYISMVPTSAHTGDGMGNLLAYLCDFAQKRLSKRLAFSEELEATVMEVKEITGLGTTIDVILVNGRLRENAHIIIAGQDRPIVTQVRGLLMPQPMKELRVKNAYTNYKEVEGAQGVKIIAKDLEKALAGLPLYSSENQFEQEVYCEEVSRGLSNVLRGIQVSEKGVYVQASTLGSLEALLEFLRTSHIPYASINIGPIHRRDVMKASVMLDRDPQWAVILAFDVKVEREAQEQADSLGVQIFTADIIYHLFDRFMKHREDLKKANQDKFKSLAVFPAKIRILPQFVFNSRDPIVCGVAIEGGILREGTPMCVPSKGMLDIGRVTSIESNKKPLQEAKKGQEVCIKIAPIPGEAPKLYGRHFDHTDLLVSKISRESIDAVKDYFREELTKDDWKLMVELKKVLGVS